MTTIGRAAIKVTSLGSAAIDAGDVRIDPSSSVLFGAALYLAAEGGRGVSRKQLQELLWPKCSQEVAAHRLRQTLLKLRQARFPIQADGKQRIVVDATVTTDVDELEERGPEALNLALLSSPVFTGFEPSFSNDFQDWFSRYQGNLIARIARVMLQEIARLRAAGKWQSLDEWCQALLRHSPENEEAILAQAESLALRGEKTAAVRSIDSYLSIIGASDTNLRFAASLLRRRIGERAQQRPAEMHDDIALLGRERELKVLGELLSRVRTRSKQVHCVVGSAGIGKTRLVNEFAAFASLQGAVCHRVSCRSSDARRPLAAMLQLIPLLRGARGAIGCSPDTLAFLETLTTHRRDRATRSHDEDGLSDQVYSKLDVALADIIDAVTEESLTLIIIEDCHWIDSTSAEVFMQLFARLEQQRVLFLLTSRQQIDDLFAGFGHLLLQPLDAEDSATLIRSIAAARGKHVSDSHVGWCIRVAEGNPYFLYELATHWIETGDEHAVPESLSSVLEQRLARLSPNALQVLQACCVLENNSRLEVIEAVLGLPAHELLSGINELAMAAMLRSAGSQTSVTSASQIESKHDLLSEKALLQLAPQALSYLHRRAAVVLESHIAHKGDASTLWACAKHWQLAGDTKQALRLAESCAQHLLEAELPTEAAEAFEKAASYCGSDSERLRILESQVIASFQSSNWRQVMSVAREARQIRSRLNPDANGHDDIELMLRRAEWQTRDWEHILADSLGCLQARDASVVHRMEAGCMALMLLSWRGDTDSATGVFATMRELSHGSRSSRLDLWLQAEMIYNTCWGSIDEAVAAGRRLVSEQRRQNNTVRLLRSLCNAAVALRVAGEFDEAAEHLREAISVAERQKIQLFKGQAIPLLAHLAIDRGLTSEAQEWLDALRSLPSIPEDPMLSAEIYSIDARLALLDGRYVYARSLVLNQLSQMAADPMPHKRVYWNALNVAADLANDGRASLKSLRRLEKEHLRTRGNVFQAFAAYTLYVGLTSVGQTSKAAILLGDYLEKFRREKWPPPAHLLATLQNMAYQRTPDPNQGTGTKALAS